MGASMLTGHLRGLLRLLTALIVAMALNACGGGGGSPGTTEPITPVPITTGALNVTTAGLPAGAGAAVRITGPDNYQLGLTGSQTVEGLAPGSYTVTAAPVSAGDITYQPAPASQSVTVAAGNTASASVAYSGGAITLATTVVVSGLDSPSWLASPPGDTRMFVLERRGRIRIVENGVVRGAPFLDIIPRVGFEGEGGLLSLAFDPQFARNGYFYLYYIDLQRNITIERFSVGQNPMLADPTSGLVILKVPHPDFLNHFGGQVVFGPDGYLYLGTGDGGGAGDPQGNARNPQSLLGKLLRLDVSRATITQPYAIPADNPYRDGVAGRPEIWALGVRNPWRFSFDDGRLYLSDVGQDEREEINIAGAGQGGLNYGWNVMEGIACYQAGSCDRNGLTLPVYDYAHGTDDINGCSVTGGFVYRGRALPELTGRYLFSDFCRGWLKSFYASTGGAIAEQRDWNLPNIGRVVSFGQDAEGELYMITTSGSIHKIVRAAAQ